MEKGVPVRSISRSIAVLQCLTRNGSPSLMEIARLAHVPYPTASRIVQTLIHEGLVEFEPSRKRYHATCKVAALAAGYREDDHLVDAAHAHLVELTRRIGWPVTMTSAVGTSVVVRACTHELSALTLSHYYRGDSFPLLECAPGHVHLAYSDESTREWLIHALEQQQRRSVALEMFSSGRLVRRILDDGYASFDRTQHTKDPGKTSTFSLPLACGQGKLAHLSVNVFASAMSLQEAVRRYLPLAREAAETIVAEWQQMKDGARAAAAPARLPTPVLQAAAHAARLQSVPLQAAA